jgi:hypothetical protein
MTFVIGSHCFNGLVMCADSEESDRINKTYVDKLYVRPVPDDWQICLGGAGDAVAIDKFRDKLSSILPMDCPSDHVKIELVTEKVLQHMQDLYPDSGYEILFAQVNLKTTETFLQRNYEHSAMLRPVESGNYECVGMDTSLAKFILRNIFDPLMGVKEALRLGLLATALSKVHSSGVSGPSMAFSYMKGDAAWQRQYSGEIAEIEKQFPIEDLRTLLRRYWMERNSDIWTITDGTEYRCVDY